MTIDLETSILGIRNLQKKRGIFSMKGNRSMQDMTEGRPISLILKFFFPLLFGMLEYSWGSSALTMILLFLCWRQTLVYENEK